MKQKLNCILLIDDDEPTNFINEMVVKQAGCAGKCIAVRSGQAALDYLKSKDDEEHPHPDLIFLDINMPVMNGWEFLEAYEQLDLAQRETIIVIMLTTSLNPDDEERAKGFESIAGFRYKPLTVEMLKEIIDKHFSDRLR